MRRAERFEIEEERRALQLVENGVDRSDDQLAQLALWRVIALFDPIEDGQELVERVLMAGVEDVFLAAEVVVEVALLHPQRGGNALDRGAVVSNATKG